MYQLIEFFIALSRSRIIIWTIFIVSKNPNNA